MGLRFTLELLCLDSVPGLKTLEGSIPSTLSRRISAVSPPDLPILKTVRETGHHSLGVSERESRNAGGRDARARPWVLSKKIRSCRRVFQDPAGIFWACVRRWAMVE